jgi:hypothetical protein
MTCDPVSLPVFGRARIRDMSKSRIAHEVDEILSQGKASEGRSSELRVLRTDNFGRLIEVRAPAVRLVKLPVGARDKYGDPITKYTPDWARLAHEKIADSARLEDARYSGHDIEGHVRIKGKRYSAFASGSPEDFVIVVHNKGGSS